MNKVDFKQKSLRETVVEALDFIGIDIDDFNLKAEYFTNKDRNDHDPRHLYRVMINCALIALETNDKRRGLLAFCGGFIHDLALEHNGGNRQHGIDSVKYKWHLFNELWDKYELSDDEKEIVKTAVIRHCDGDNIYGYKEDKIVNYILHSADAFDRARFYHTSARLNWNYLKHPDLVVQNDQPNQHLRKLIAESESVCAFTKDVDTYLEFREFISNIR